MKRRLVGLLALLILGAGAVWYTLEARAAPLVLTGIVTTQNVIVSPQIGGQIGQLLVNEGDTVTRGQVVAVIVSDELRADHDYYTHSNEGLVSQVAESRAALRFEERHTADQIRQAQATVEAATADQASATADLESARQTLERQRELARQSIASAQDFDRARTAYDAAKAKVDALARQVDAQRAALALARANAEQIAVRRSQVVGTEHQQEAAAAQQTRAGVRLAYSEVRAPLDAIVDVRAARLGEVVAAAQPILTLIDPNDLWVRADVEETYIARIRVGDRLIVRLPSGDERTGTVFHRGVDADFATQRDVSRTKRDIKTFEVRLRVDNRDRRLAVGMTAYVLLPAAAESPAP